MKKEMVHKECEAVVQPVRDALYVLGGKWKMPLIGALMFGNKRFADLKRDLPGITARMLSKELREMELNDLVARHTNDDDTAIYFLTPHSESLMEVIESLRKWGVQHRSFLAEKCKLVKKKAG